MLVCTRAYTCNAQTRIKNIAQFSEKYFKEEASSFQITFKVK